MKKTILLILVFLSFWVVQVNGQLSVTAVDTDFTIDFDNTVAGINEGAITGTGFATTPVEGQLNTAGWAITGLSDGDKDFGIENVSGDYARGTSASSTSGGMYGYEVETDNWAFGVLPGGSDLTPGTIAMKMQNNTGVAFENGTVSFSIWVNNWAERSQTFNGEVSLDGTNWTSIPDFAFETPEASDANGWTETTFTSSFDLTLSDGEVAYFRWNSDDNGGSGSRDRIAIDDIVVNFSAGSSAIDVVRTSDMIGQDPGTSGGILEYSWTQGTSTLEITQTAPNLVPYVEANEGYPPTSGNWVGVGIDFPTGFSESDILGLTIDGTSYTLPILSAAEVTNGKLWYYFDMNNPAKASESHTLVINWSSAFNPETIIINATDLQLEEAGCVAITSFPFTESFEGTYPVDCWDTIYANTSYPSGNTMSHSTTNAYDGSQSFRFSSISSGSPYEQYLVSPELSLDGIKLLSFWYRAHSSYGTETFAVGYSTTGNDVNNDFTWESDVSADLLSWVEYTDNIPADVKYVAIQYKSSYEYYLYVDAFSIRELSSENAITAFTHENLTEAATIDETAFTVTAEVAMGTDLTTLAPVITISDYASISPESEIAQDFSAGAVAYTVTAESGVDQIWNVTVTASTTQSSENDILTFVLDEQTIPAVINAGTVAITCGWLTDVTSLTPTITTSAFATISPESGVEQDFTSPVTYTVTAEDGTSTQEYIATVTLGDTPLGANCSNPYLVSLPTDLPYTQTEMTTCGFGHSYDDNEELGYYDNEEDVIYKITVASDTYVNMILNPNGTSYTSMSLFDACPDTGSIIESVATYTSSEKSFEVALVAGTYYVMIDRSSYGYDCIADYDFTIEETCPAPTEIEAINMTATTADIQWLASGFETAWNLKVDTVSIDPTTDAADIFDALVSTTPLQAVTGLTAETMYYVYVQANCGSDWVEYTFTTPSTCPQPVDVSASAGSDMAEISWEAYGMTEWNIIVSDSSINLTTVDLTTVEDHLVANELTTDNPYTVTNLTANTTYYVYIQSSCGSDWSTEYDFTTECGIYSIPFLETFDTYVPDCWSEFTGLLEATTISTSSSSNWLADDYLNTIANGKCAKNNVYGTSRKDWMVTPSIDLGDGSTIYELKFNLGLTDFGNTLAAEMTGTDDKFAVVISTDNGVTWSDANALGLWDNAGSSFVYNDIATSGEEIILSLNGYTGIVKFGFYVESTDYNADNDLFVDNVSVDVQPSCLSATNLMVNSYTSTEVTLSWTENGTATSWNIIYGATGFDPTTQGDTVIADATTFTVESLTADTQYDFYVQVDCGSGLLSTLAGPVTETTAIECPVPTDIVITPSTNMAEVAWIDYGQTAWNIKLSTTSIDPTTEEGDIYANEAITSNPFTIPNLAANTMYYVYIQSSCGSDWSVETTFTTECEVISTLPFHETFNSDSPTESCWVSLNENADDTEWDMDYTSNTYEGNQVAMIHTDYNNGSNNDYLVTPGIALTGNEILTYQYRVQSTNEPNDFELLLSTTGNSPDDFTTVLLPNTSYSNIDYTLETIDLSAYTGTVYIAWHVINGGLDGWRLYIDDVYLRSISDENAITAFEHTALTGAATIDGTAFTVTAEVAMGTDLTTIAPVITVSDYATISPESGVAQDFSAGAVAYTVTSESGVDQVWNVTVTASTTQSSENNILTFVLDDETTPATIVSGTNPGTIAISVNWYAEITSLSPTITLSTLATVSPESGVAQDFTNPVTYTVTAEDGTTQDYIVTVTVEDTPAGVACDDPIIYGQINNPEVVDVINPSTRELWFAVTLDQAYVDIQVSTCPSVYDTKVYVYDECEGSQLAYNDDAPDGFCSEDNSQSLAEIDYLEAGTYYVKVIPYTTTTDISDPTTGVYITGSTCATPTDVLATNITATTATIIWTEILSSDEWNLKVSTTSAADATSATGDIFDGTVSTTPAQALTGLTAETTYYVYVQSTCGSDWTSEYTFTTPSTCPQPTDVIATVGSDMAEISWTDYGMTAWNIKVSTTSIDPTTTEGDILANEAITDNPYTLTDLTANTMYYVYIQSSCESDWSVEYAFTTECDIISVLPWTETFEDDSDTRTCWSQIQEQGTHDWTFASGSSGGLITTAYNGLLNARFTGSTYSGDMTKLVSPKIDLSETGTYVLDFYYGQDAWGSDQNTLKVYYRISDMDVWVEIGNYTDNVDAWTMESITLPNTSATYQIAFEGTDNYGYANVIDDVTISHIEVTDLALVEPTSGYSCDLTATQQIPVEFENVGATTIATGETVTFTVESEGATILTEDITLTEDLAPESSWSGVTTNTVDMSAIGTIMYKASITYVNDANALNDTIEGYIVSFDQSIDFTDAVNDTITISSSDFPYTIESNVTITPDSTLVSEYLWNSGETTSDLIVSADGWNILTVTTEDCQTTDSVYIVSYNNVNNIVENEFSVYPNPTNGEFMIEMNLVESQDVVISIYNTNGQIVRQINIDDINQVTRKISMNDVAEGLYYIRISAGNTEFNRQIVIR